MEWKAPAKINLNLRVLGKRPDGFHALETLMIPISLHDSLTVQKATTGITLTCSDPSLPCDAGNLAYKAAALFFEHFKIRDGVHLHLEKRTPHGAGLGGGSSDAATVLRALRTTFNVNASDEELAGLASKLGSDVPFFVYLKPAWCKGRGEIIEPTELQDDYFGLLVHPGFGVPTPWAYQTYAKSPQTGTPGKSTSDTVLQNDLEPPVFTKYHWISTVKQWFQQQPEVFDALMSGSGSSVFALTHQRDGIESLQERFRSEYGANIFATPFEIYRSA